MRVGQASMIRSARASDGLRLAEIYNYYIRNTVVSFEEEEVSTQDMQMRIAEVEQAQLPWIVYENTNSELEGFAYANKWKGRCAYRHSVEVTVYLDHNSTGRGLGNALYTELFSLLKQKSVHVVLGGISLPNAASIALHEKFGMEKVAHFKEIGFKFEKWVDVAYWQGFLS